MRPALQGIVFALCATACFSVLDTTGQYISASVPLVMALWMRFLMQSIATAAIVLPKRGWQAMHTTRLPMHILRALALLCSSGMAYLSLRYVPVAEFSAIVMVSPLAVTVFATLVFKERVSKARWALIIGAFVGTVVIVRPGAHSFEPTLLLPLAVVAFGVVFQLLTSSLTTTEEPLVVHLYTGLAALAVSSLALPFVWQTLAPSSLWGYLLLLALASTVGHFMLIMAFSKASAATITPFLYAQIGFGTLGGYLVFGYFPDGWSQLGMAMIAVCGVGCAWLTMREAGQAAAASP
jgi:drug/metabolite transporter (DMT)-like permease